MTLEQIYVKSREQVALPEGVVSYLEPRTKKDHEGEKPTARYGLVHLVKINEDATQKREVRDNLFELEYHPGPYYARVDFSASDEKDRNIVMNTAGLMAREIVIRFALLRDYTQLHDVVFEKLRKYQQIAQDRKGDDLGNESDYLALSVPSLNLDDSIEGYKAAIHTSWTELSRIEAETLKLVQDADRIGVIQVWDSAMAPLSTKDLLRVIAEREKKK